MNKIEVIITGGRDYDNISTTSRVLDSLNVGLIVQGGASGADTLALNYAQSRDLEFLTYKADWNKHGKAAGPIRNREMLLAFPNAIVVAFPGGKGTENCIKQAIELKHIVLKVL